MTADAEIQARLGHGVVLQQQGRKGEASRIFEEVLQEAPENFHARYFLAMMALEAGDLAGGIAQLRQAIASDPTQAVAHRNLGRALQKRGAPEEAVTAFAAAVALAPDDSEARMDHAHALKRANRLSEAMAAYDALLARQPGHAL